MRPEIINLIYSHAKKSNATILLADVDDRAREAKRIAEEQGLAKVVLVDDTMASTDVLNYVVEKMHLTLDAARTQLRDSRYLAAAIVGSGMADGYIAGNICTTPETIRPALKLIGTADGYASSYFLMIHNGKPLFFADAGFNISPNPEQLARIAIDTARSAQYYGIEPKVAFLSFSTKGSASHEEVDKMRKAYELARALAPDIAMDGELQFDAAFVPSVAQRKAPGSAVAGYANVFVFPDLNSGNIAYKIAERMAGATALGPLMQGFKKPVNDLSRGCSVQDIVDVIAVTAMQSRRS